MLIIAPCFSEADDKMVKVKSTLKRAVVTLKDDVTFKEFKDFINDYEYDYFKFKKKGKNKVIVTLK